MRKTNSYAAAAALLAASLSPMVALADDTARGPSVALSFSPAALEQLTETSEEVVLRLTYFVHPSPAGRERADESGEIDLGNHALQIAAAPGVVDLSGGAPQEIDDAFVSEPPKVNINVGSARLASEDNILSCDVFEGYLERLSTQEFTLHCSLISEGRRNILVTGDPSLVGPEWAVSSIAGKEILTGAPVTLQFFPNGRLAGTGGCNQLVSSYTVDGALMEIAAIGTTRRVCEDAVMAQEAQLTELLDQIYVFRMPPMGKLTLETKDGTAIRARATSVD